MVVGMNSTLPMAGVFAPVITPFKPDLSPDSDRLIRHCRWLLANDVGLAVFGTNSEGNSLSVDERIALLDDLIDAGLDPARMMPGTGCSAFTDTVRLTAHAVKRGCGGVLMLPPFYYKNVSDEGLFRTFSEIIQRVGDARLRVFLYHIPQFSMVPISLGVTERLLAAYPGQVAGMKDSSGDWSNTAAFLDAFAADGFQVFPGRRDHAAARTPAARRRVHQCHRQREPRPHRRPLPHLARSRRRREAGQARHRSAPSSPGSP